MLHSANFGVNVVFRHCPAHIKANSSLICHETPADYVENVDAMLIHHLEQEPPIALSTVQTFIKPERALPCFSISDYWIVSVSLSSLGVILSGNGVNQWIGPNLFGKALSSCNILMSYWKLCEHQKVRFVCFVLFFSPFLSFPKLLSLVSVNGLPGVLAVPTIFKVFLHPRPPLFLCESAVRGASSRSESITEINGALWCLAQKASCPFTPDCVWAE